MARAASSHTPSLALAPALALASAQAEAMGREARALVEREYSWDATFDHLFGAIYPKALDAAQARVKRGPLGFRPVYKFLNGTA